MTGRIPDSAPFLRFPEWGESPYFSVTVRKTTTLSDLLTHLYVLIPVFDNRKHYWVGDDELEKLLAKGEGWLAGHPEKEEENGKRYVIFQVWDFVDQVYDLAMYFVVDDRTSEQLVTHVMRTKYNAVGTDHLLALMGRAGFARAERLDGRFYQPVLVGNRDK